MMENVKVGTSKRSLIPMTMSFLQIEDCRNVQCSDDKVCLLVRNTGEPICYPKTHCNSNLNPEPVCGTNGITYPNVCAMRISADRRGRTPDVAHQGPCGKILPPPRLRFFIL